ncbi:MAG: hypothetical protein ACREDF_04040 [Thermoplasmata archaeon]
MKGTYRSKVLREFESGPYLVRHEFVSIAKGSKPVLVKSAYSKEGHYIGDPEVAERLWKRYGIEQFELRTSKSQVCSIGWSQRDKLWYGWSHRAIDGFKTKREAADFAESVS